MDKKYKNQYRIPSSRAHWHDYNEGSYFITICTTNREHFFGEIQNNEMILSEIGNYTQNSIEQIESLHKDVRVPVFQVMPNHIHFIMVVKSPYNDNSKCEATTKDIIINTEMHSIADLCGRASHIISRFKSAVTKYARQNKIRFGWQARFYDHIIRDTIEWDLISNYIRDNVFNWGADKFHE